MVEAEVKEKIWELEAEFSGKYNLPICLCDKISEYIVKGREIRPYSDFAGFCIDDDEAFIECIIGMKLDKIYNQIISLFNYMNRKFGYDVDMNERLCFYDTLGWDSDPISIKKLYGINIAACTERATFAHNILKILGYNATLIIGYLSRDMVKEGHCYNLINVKDGLNILLDTSCWVVACAEGDSSLRRMLPAIAKLSNSEYSGILRGEICYLDNSNIMLPKGFTLLKEERRFYQ